MAKLRSISSVLSDIKRLIKEKGYIYALCMILFEDFRVALEKLHEIDYQARLSTKEASLLVGFLIQNKVDFSLPERWQAVADLKKKTYELMEELHNSFHNAFLDKLEENIEVPVKEESYRQAKKDFFGTGNMLIESIFYSGDGVYDFQYLDFLEDKYKLDRDWLLKNKGFDTSQVKTFVIQVKDILQEKSKKVRHYSLKENKPTYLKKVKKQDPIADAEKVVDEALSWLEFYQYVELFKEHLDSEDTLSKEELRDKSWESFYRELIELFVIRKTDFDDEISAEHLLNTFSLSYEPGLNANFQAIGDFNLINAKPIIKLDEERYFVPIGYLLSEAVYETPFYWMQDDENYSDKAGKNRGLTGENLAYNLLQNIFGKQRTFGSVKISSKKGQDDTDIDVLCILGSKALCVQVKSKKLTLLSRTGNDKQLQEDFQGAAQDAYNQCLISRKRILEGQSRFFDKNHNEITLSEEIDDVYLIAITTENYPSLTHQADVMLEKDESDPYPLIATVFDLELIIQYLPDPYDFLYYIKQRTSLMEYFKAGEEIIFLGYHLDQKLWKQPRSDLLMILPDFGQLIDRNYYPQKAGVEVSDEGDAIKNKWKNEDFDKLCSQIKLLNAAKTTDIIFHLLDWSGEGRKNLVEVMAKTKRKTLKDGKSHDFSMPPDEAYKPRLGASYYSLNADNIAELQNRLLSLCEARKYRSKGDLWIGFGSLMSSSNIIDAVVFNDQAWKYDAELEKFSKALLDKQRHGRQIRLGEKVGRNGKCPCGSSRKYKFCCGK